MFPDMAETL